MVKPLLRGPPQEAIAKQLVYFLQLAPTRILRVMGGVSVLHGAIKASAPQTVQILLEAGANAGQVDLYGHSILHCVGGANAGKTVDCLIKAGAEPNIKEMHRGSPLHFFVIRCNVEATKTILDLGADIDLLDHEGDSALSGSMCSGADETTELLLSYGAKYTTWDSNGRSLLHIAAFFGSLRTLHILHDAKLHGIDPDALSRQGQTALQIAQARASRPEGFVEELQELLMDIRVRNANLQGPLGTNLDEHDNVAIKSQRPHLVQTTRLAARSRLRDIITRLVQVSLLLALTCLGSRYVYGVLGLDRVVQSLAHVWNMVSPDNFMKL